MRRAEAEKKLNAVFEDRSPAGGVAGMLDKMARHGLVVLDPEPKPTPHSIIAHLPSIEPRVKALHPTDFTYSRPELGDWYANRIIGALKEAGYEILHFGIKSPPVTRNAEPADTQQARPEASPSPLTTPYDALRPLGVIFASSALSKLDAAGFIVVRKGGPDVRSPT